MEVVLLTENEATRWAYKEREGRELNDLESVGAYWSAVEAVELLHLSAETFKGCACWCGSTLWLVLSSDQMQGLTLENGYILKSVCVVGLALLLVFENQGRELVYRAIY